MSKVFIEQIDSYDSIKVKESLRKLIVDNNLLSLIKDNSKVVIKANLVAAFDPSKAVTTHPTLLIELTKLLLEKGCKVIIGDSGGGLFNDTFMKTIYHKCGLNEVNKLDNAALNYNYNHRVVDFDGLVVKRLDVCDYLLDCDYIINFAKLKAHGMMVLSNSVKNMFGTVPGTVKLEYHYKYNTHTDFANMLIDINEYYKPVLNIVDAIDIMEGNGPTQGTVTKLNLLLASTNPYDIDVICSKLINLDYHEVPYLKEAENRKLISEDIETNLDINPLIKKDFKNIKHLDSLEFAKNTKLVLIPKIIKKILETKPNCKKSKCIGCSKCANICPAHAITMKNKKPVIDRTKCIKCFCCQEFCPVGSMKVKRTLLSRIIRK